MKLLLSLVIGVFILSVSVSTGAEQSLRSGSIPTLQLLTAERFIQRKAEKS